jgi:F0F1-type ATP synthase membrane subunit b/b'
MTSYAKLPSENSKGPSKSIQELSAYLKEFEQKLKDLRKLYSEASSKRNQNIFELIELKKHEIITLINSIKPLLKLQVLSSEKQILEKLRKISEELFKQFSDLEQREITDPATRESQGEIESEFVYSEDISIQSSGELDNQVIKERLDNIKDIQKDFHEVNNLFKEVAEMVSEQGAMLDESEKNVDTAVKETSRANVELESADKYQRSAKKKVFCIFIIVLGVVGVILGIVLATKL